MTTTSRILDLLADAVLRCQRGEDGAAWVWHVQMTSNDRLAFDLWLVRTKDKLAWKAGPPEQRFRNKVRRMLQAT